MVPTVIILSEFLLNLTCTFIKRILTIVNYASNLNISEKVKKRGLYTYFKFGKEFKYLPRVLTPTGLKKINFLQFDTFQKKIYPI